MIYGYARVSVRSDDDASNLQNQLRLLEPICDEVFTDVMSGGRFDRPSFQELRNLVESGDEIVVVRLDRLGRSLIDMLNLATEMDSRGVGIRSLSETLDRDTAMGRMMWTLILSFAQMERELISERTLAGLERTRINGTGLGPRLKLTKEQVLDLQAKRREGYSWSRCMRLYPVALGTLQRMGKLDVNTIPANKWPKA